LTTTGTTVVRWLAVTDFTIVPARTEFGSDPTGGVS
jgi:hypothetical protein